MEQTTVQARMDKALKEDAEEILNDMGLSVSDGMRLFLRQVVNTGGLPFQPMTKKPSAVSRAALEEARARKGKRFSNTKDLFAHLREPDEPANA